MRAVTIEDGKLIWAERDDPDPGHRQLLVDVRAAGINAADLMQRHGAYPAPPGVPADIPGLELAGEVKAVGGDVTRFRTGDRVMAVVGGGAHAELAIIEEDSAIAVPRTLAWPEAGGFPEAFSTAYDALFTQCGLSIGEKVLVTGAAGGVGIAGVQLAAAAGAHVTASVRAAEMRDSVMALGAHEALDPGEALSRGPFDVVLELIAGQGVAEAVRALSTGGRIVVIGVGGGATVELDLLQMMRHRARISSSTLRARSLTEKANVARAVEAHVVPLLGAERIRVPIVATFEMSDAAEAYDRFAEGKKLGKIVLVNP